MCTGLWTDDLLTCAYLLLYTVMWVVTFKIHNICVIVTSLTESYMTNVTVVEGAGSPASWYSTTTHLCTSHGRHGCLILTTYLVQYGTKPFLQVQYTFFKSHTPNLSFSFYRMEGHVSLIRNFAIKLCGSWNDYFAARHLYSFRVLAYLACCSFGLVNPSHFVSQHIPGVHEQVTENNANQRSP